MDSLALDANWDLTVDAYGNWRTVGDATPGNLTGAGYRLAQDVATRCLSWRGEVYFDTTQGVPYDSVLGEYASISYLQQLYTVEALAVPTCAQALPNLTLTRGSKRTLTGSITVADFVGNVGTIAL